ncbi:hypothetical protein OC835_006756 [Tilletia horrida]|nr:hypothetical protein OC835_006756 [Tilletia horrida]
MSFTLLLRLVFFLLAALAVAALSTQNDARPHFVRAQDDPPAVPGPRTTNVELVLEDNGKESLPRLMLPVQVGSTGATVNTYLSGGNSDCIFSTASFDPTNSTTAIGRQRVFRNPYGGSSSGDLLADTLETGGISISNYTMGSIKGPNRFGVCGIRWLKEGATSLFGRSAAYRSFVYPYKSSGAIVRATFGLALDLNGASTFSLGTSLHEVASDHWVRVDTEAPGSWSMHGAIAGVADYMTINPAMTSIMVSPEQATEIMHSIGVVPVVDSNEDVIATYLCTQPPSIVVTIGNVNVSLTRTVLTYAKDKDGRCILPITGTKGYNDIPTLGTSLIASLKELVFDYDELALGIVPL